MRVALVHDWLTGMRGGEKCLEVFCEIFPDAELFTLLHVRGSVSPVIEKMKIQTSIIQNLPFARTRYRYYLPLFPTAIEKFDLREFDLILSSSHSVAKGVIPPPGALHVCYCHTPMRYIWPMYEEYFGRRSGILRFAAPLIIPYLRRWDISSSRRVDRFIANSENVRGRIRRYYGREAEVIYPPVRTEYTRLSTEDRGYFLIVSALVPYKRVDLAVEAFNRLGEHLVIVGTGSESRRLRRMARKNIEFTGWVGRRVLDRYYAGCRGLVFPGEEDLGIVPIEAQCYGKAVIAFGAGGVLETVQGRWLGSAAPKGKGVTGIFFRKQTVPQLIEAVREFCETAFDPRCIRNHAVKFDEKNFKDKVTQAFDPYLTAEQRR